MNVKEQIHESWYPIIGNIYQEPLNYLNQKILPNISYQPKKENIFKVFEKPLKSIKVVVLGQDPYPTPGDAIGRAFAVSKDARIPVSLRNINIEATNCSENEKWKTLEHWDKQGVFLLNAALTVETGKAGSHLKYWEIFTRKVVNFISLVNPCIWVLWGKKAQKFQPYIQNVHSIKGYNSETIQNIPLIPDSNYVLTAPHPAAEAYTGGKAGFFGCNHFKHINDILEKKKEKQIIW